jgi:hypothetical protein
MCQNLELTDSGKKIIFELIQGHNNETGSDTSAESRC